jgi:hypothetical protein
MYRGKKSRRPKRRQAKPSKKLVSTIKKVVSRGTETKRHIVLAGNEDVVNSLTGFYASRLLNIPQGDTSFEREGDKIRGISCYGKILFHNSSSADLGVRVMVLYDKKETGSDITDADEIYENILDTAISTASLKAVKESLVLTNPLNTERYGVKYDKMFTLHAPSSGCGSNYRIVPLYFKDGGAIQYESSTTSAPVKKNYQYVVVVARLDNDTSLGTNLEMTGRLEYKFKDM